jgi:nucleolar protein 56
MPTYWFGDVDEQGCMPVARELEARVRHLKSLIVMNKSFTPLEWHQAVSCGVVKDRADYLDQLRQLCFHLAEQRIIAYFRGRDIELLQMVRTLDQLDEAINLLTERAVEWYRTRNPSFSRKYRWLPGRKMVEKIKRDTSGTLRQFSEEIERLSNLRRTLMYEVSGRAEQVLPNCSALIGGLVAARLMERAGGLEPLSQMPASAIQVIGARTALFSHMRSGTPPPKHGIIFQHRRVHSAGRDVRGRVARILAAKLAIAARVDYYRGELAPEFVAKAQAAIDHAGVKNALD